MQPDTETKELQLLRTADGSHTLLRTDWDEPYHSRNGAITESRHIYIRHGLESRLPLQCIHVLETGFGTGLNALLTLLAAEKNHTEVLYTAVEKFPLSLATVKRLNYPRLLDVPQQLFCNLHRAETEFRRFSPYFSLKVIRDDILHAELPLQTYGLVYHDAFDPARQPELWTPALFERLRCAMEKGGFLLSYSAKGAVRRALQAVGFEVERLPGPPGKREISRAVCK